MSLDEIRKMLGTQLYLDAMITISGQSVNSQQGMPKGKYSGKYLAWIGDAVLNLIVIERLKEILSQKRKRFYMSSVVPKVVSREYLRCVAKKMRMHSDFDEFRKEFGLKGPGTGFRHPAEAIEALIGALYLTYGYKRATEFVDEVILGPFLKMRGINLQAVHQPTSQAIKTKIQNSINFSGFNKESVARSYGLVKEPVSLVDCRV